MRAGLFSQFDKEYTSARNAVIGDGNIFVRAELFRGELARSTHVMPFAISSVSSSTNRGARHLHKRVAATLRLLRAGMILF